MTFSCATLITAIATVALAVFAVVTAVSAEREDSYGSEGGATRPRRASN